MKLFRFNIFFISFFLLIIQFSFAQNSIQYKNIFDIALSSSNNNFTSAFSWARLYGIGKKQKFKIGYGARLNIAFMNKKDFVTAPASLTSGVNNPSALFSNNILANYDTLTLEKGQINALNLSIHLQYEISARLEVGFNIDAIGFSFGKAQTGVFQSSIYPNNSQTKQLTTQNARPTHLNLLLISDNDIGSLNSEIYLRYWLNNNWGIKAGGTFIFSEYTTDKKLALDNDRFRYKSLQLMLGITYRLVKK
ncbi:MAG: hypothetical protein EAZ85_11430 [Bacteroidetes bacterium]|nr:MAG: hypothetical protein EAZ85_11430 [Bacteroidota bacterium]TAG89430.1 MAG: hypothetical protein EAZ20_06525 [Bacteroidota bacterium]